MNDDNQEIELIKKRLAALEVIVNHKKVLADKKSISHSSHKYWKLSSFFKSNDSRTITLTLSQIEDILGFSLPLSAQTQKSFYANSPTHPISLAWMENGYKSRGIDLVRREITFVKETRNDIEPLFVENKWLKAFLPDGTADDYIHLLFVIVFSCDDYQTTTVRINNKSFPLRKPYGYRSQGNIHLIFGTESNYFCALGFDGHKGQIRVNSNHLIQGLIQELNVETGKKSFDIFKVTEEDILSILSRVSDNSDIENW